MNNKYSKIIIPLLSVTSIVLLSSISISLAWYATGNSLTIDNMKVTLARVDERLTTVEAHKTMNFLNVNKYKKRDIVDTISAVYILESYMKMQKDN